MNITAQWSENDRKRAQNAAQHDAAALAGGQAARNGFAVTVNPHTDPELRRTWQIGWNAAKVQLERR